MLVFVLREDHGNGDHHAGYDKENLDRMRQQVKGVKQQSWGNVTRCAADVMIQTNTHRSESS